MRDPLGEALSNAEWRARIGWSEAQIVAAARKWEALPSRENIETAAKALAYDAGKDITDWDSTPDQFLNPWRHKASVALGALAVTANE